MCVDTMKGQARETGRNCTFCFCSRRYWVPEGQIAMFLKWQLVFGQNTIFRAAL